MLKAFHHILKCSGRIPLRIFSLCHFTYWNSSSTESTYPPRPAVFQLTKCRCTQISKSTSSAAPFFDWLVENGKSWRRTVSPPSSNLGVRIFPFFCHFSHIDYRRSTMASEHDRAVLQAIFNPTTPFGDVPGLNQDEELTDDGESEPAWCVSTYHVAPFYVYHFIAY